MKKHHLVSAALACTVAASLMVGAAYAPQEAYTDPSGLNQVGTAVQTASASLCDEAENANMLVEKALEEQAAKAEAEEKAAAEQKESAAANTKSSKSSANKSTSSSKAGSTSSKKSTSSSSSASKSSASKNTCTITVDGVEMSYTQSYGASSAPSSGAGVWKGSDSTTDGSYGYFIGHNPGSFSSAATASNGSKVTVNDSNGDSRTYTVVDSFVVPRGSTWGDISDRVTNHGESVVLQTCVDDGYRVVIAE